LDPPDFPNSLH